MLTISFVHNCCHLSLVHHKQTQFGPVQAQTFVHILAQPPERNGRSQRAAALACCVVSPPTTLHSVPQQPDHACEHVVVVYAH